MKRFFTASALAFSLAAASSANAQIITLSPDELASNMQQLAQLQQQWETLKDQLQEQQRQLEAMTGSAGYGNIFGNSARSYQEQFPEDWGDVYGSGNDYASDAEDMLRELDQITDGMSPQEAIEYTREQVREKNAHDSIVMQQVYNNQLAELEEIERLTDEIDRAVTQKEIEDLQARIQTAQGAIAAEQLKVQNMVALQDAQQRLYEDQRRRAFMNRVVGDRDSVNSPSITN